MLSFAVSTELAINLFSIEVFFTTKKPRHQDIYIITQENIFSYSQINEISVYSVYSVVIVLFTLQRDVQLFELGRFGG